MPWPFVTRRAFELMEQQRNELQKKYDDLWNQFVWRLSGVPLDPGALPAGLREAAMPKKETTQDRGSILTDVKEKSADPMSVRAKLKQIEEQRERDFETVSGRIHVVNTQEVKEA
jgi:hypothetical protein